MELSQGVAEDLGERDEGGGAWVCARVCPSECVRVWVCACVCLRPGGSVPGVCAACVRVLVCARVCACPCLCVCV